MDKRRETRSNLEVMFTNRNSPMGQPIFFLCMGDALPFNAEEIEKVEDSAIGNYALGIVDELGDFVVGYVGRSDTINDEKPTGLKKRLMQHLEEDYSHFKFSYAETVQDAFEKECQNYHDFGEKELLHNKIHPDAPKGTTLSCPKDGCNHPN